MAATDPSETADETALYEVVPEQFVGARDALAKRLRAAGDRSGAARVAKLRRPTLTAWALNQVARTAPARIAELLDAGSELRAAMERALRGDASGLRHGRDNDRSVVDAIVTDAVRHMTAAGYTATDAMRRRMATTLRAAIVDESVADQLGSGVLDQDRDVPGFGMDALSGPLTSVRPVEQAAGGGEGETRLAERAELAQRHQETNQEAERSGAEADRLAAEADRLAAEADRLAAEADRLAAEAKQVLEQATEARHRAASAVEIAAAARAEADRLASLMTADDPATGQAGR